MADFFSQLSVNYSSIKCTEIEKDIRTWGGGSFRVYEPIALSKYKISFRRALNVINVSSSSKQENCAAGIRYSIAFSRDLDARQVTDVSTSLHVNFTYLTFNCKQNSNNNFVIKKLTSSEC